jgi:hypothetical protein
MGASNVEIVQECFAEIFNAKHLDRIFDYFDEGCVIRHAPYVGVGMFPEEVGGGPPVVKSVADKGPSAGKMLVGDVLLRVSDQGHTWESPEELRSGLWGQGALGTEVTFGLLRNGIPVEVNVTRGRVESFDITMAEMKDDLQHTLQHEMPDLSVEITLILGAEDLVAFFAVDRGTSATYGRSAIWSECNIMRLSNGRIVEWWGTEDGFARLRQLGFQMSEPAKVAA